ncbi:MULTISPECIES: DUF417 family protein [Pseudoalteromonas]|uniref:Uncharacterized membrane protein YkgB n=1 Tax=Pseudoalteromonas lipolytica TaxID=570156 RepID=A0ABY1GCI7_9GAMM|nr:MULTISPECIES: DUF417 family protein [Pseudoalteromonas]MBE0352664.1 hypothetical protein [Pseudoalteromonas lipolytica LMEB 39]MCC9663191.1 DUF417 family protein [Pseudoalteromonas sp. MB41]SFT39102.1 Uncharacterized membrane protein YkgB [Pseudoalteromonas lipolytica]
MAFTNTQLTTFNALGEKLEKAGVPLIYITLGIIYIWFGGIKFSAGQAEGMYGMIANNPLVSWMYALFSKQGLVNFLGSLEIIIGLLFFARFINPALSVLGGLLSMALFTVTISMMVFLSGITSDVGFPVLSFVGEFLLKDIGLFAASLFVAGNSLKALVAKQNAQ